MSKPNNLPRKCQISQVTQGGVGHPLLSLSLALSLPCSRCNSYCYSLLAIKHNAGVWREGHLSLSRAYELIIATVVASRAETMHEKSPKPRYRHQVQGGCKSRPRILYNPRVTPVSRRSKPGKVSYVYDVMMDDCNAPSYFQVLFGSLLFTILLRLLTRLSRISSDSTSRSRLLERAMTEKYVEALSALPYRFSISVVIPFLTSVTSAMPIRACATFLFCELH